jgi:hypothetical protein
MVENARNRSFFTSKTSNLKKCKDKAFTAKPLPYGMFQRAMSLSAVSLFKAEAQAGARFVGIPPCPAFSRQTDTSFTHPPLPGRLQDSVSLKGDEKLRIETDLFGRITG